MLHRIHISAVLNGYVVGVGCQTVVFNSRQELLRELDRYLENPEATEKKYRTEAIHRAMLQGPAQPVAPCDPQPMIAPLPSSLNGGVLTPPGY